MQNDNLDLDVQESSLGSTASNSQAQGLHAAQQWRVVITNKLLIVAESSKFKDCPSMG